MSKCDSVLKPLVNGFEEKSPGHVSIASVLKWPEQASLTQHRHFQSPNPPQNVSGMAETNTPAQVFQEIEGVLQPNDIAPVGTDVYLDSNSARTQAPPQTRPVVAPPQAVSL